MYLLLQLNLAATFISFGMAIFISRLIIKNFRARFLFLLVIAISVYTFGYYSQQLTVYNEHLLLFWIRFKYLGVAFIPVLIGLLAIHISKFNQEEKLPYLYYIILLPSIIVLLSQWLYPFSHLYYTDFDIDFSKKYFNLYIGKGPLYYLHMGQTLFYAALSLVIYGRNVIKSKGSAKTSYILMFTGIALPALIFTLFSLDFFPRGFDPIPITLAFVGLLFAVGLFSERLVSDLTNAKSKYFENSLNPVLIFNRFGKLIDLNLSANDKLTLDKNSVLHKKWIDIETQLLGESKKKIIDLEEFAYKNKIYKVDKLYFCNEIGKKRGIIRSFYDVTKEKKAIEVLEKEAGFDGLTGLLNRKRWDKKVKEFIKYGSRYKHPGTLLILDLDKFKLINDTYGHQGGDTVLVEIASRLDMTIRGTDIVGRYAGEEECLLGRYGGEEICLWLNATNMESSRVVAERCRKVIESSPVKYKDLSIPVTASIGGYGVDCINDVSMTEFIEKADKALYKAKENGRNRVYYYTES